MDRVLSVRVDESVIHRVDHLARRLGMTKKALIEGAIAHYSEEIESDKEDLDVLSQTFGSWTRSESTIETAQRRRSTFRDSSPSRASQ